MADTPAPATSSWLDSLGSFFGTVGTVWNSTNNVKVAQLKVTSLQGELDLLKATNNGKEIDLKSKQLEVEQTKLEEATKLAGYSFALKGVVVVSFLAIVLTYIKNPFKILK
jgi:hypothetical protein